MEYFITTKDFLISGEEFQLARDSEKDMLVTTPRPENLDPYYNSADYISHTDSKKGIIASLYQWVKRLSIQKKLEIIQKYSGDNKTILDIGAGTGDLLAAALSAGYTVAGTEPNKSARELAAKKGIELQAALDVDGKFQIISLWHVLEHLPDPKSEIEKLSYLLNDKGVLLIAAPNFRSYDANYYKSYWAAYDVPRHLWHFSRDAIKVLTEECQMKIVEIRPMIFDAFYISLLSEKYRSGKSNFLKAFYRGLLSNIKAKKTGEYSSLLYIVRKTT